jgi:dihydroflavonol-4-reductase
MHALVIGGNGFVGSHLVRHLLACNITVTATYRNNTPTELSATTWQQLDILDVEACDDIIAGHTHVFHCANAVSFDSADAEALLHNNVEGTANVVNACLEHQVEKLLFVSSVAAIGRAHAGALVTEKTPWLTNSQNSTYAVSKYRAEMEVWRGSGEGLKVVIVNPSIILGEGDWHSSSAQLFKHAYDEFPFYTSGANGFVDVHDVVRAMQLLMQSDIYNERFILNGGNHSYEFILQNMATAMQRKPPARLAKPWMTAIVWRLYALRKLFTGKRALITQETARTAQSKYAYDGSKIVNLLPQYTYTSIEQTIARACAFYVAKQG